MKIRHRYLTQLISWTCVIICRTLYATCRIERVESVPGNSPYADSQNASSERFLYSIWHDILLMTIFCGRPAHMAGLVSRHRDGGYLAELMKICRIQPVRGSSKRGGSQAAKQCLDAAKEYHIAITPDGPRGPRHQAKDGIVFLASQTGRQIIPVSARCKRYWRIQGKWTDMLVPKPFTKVIILSGQPYSVPTNLKRDELEPYVEQLNQLMSETEAEAERLIQGQIPSSALDESQQQTRAA